MDKRAYRAASSRMRLERLVRTADLLAWQYVHGYECGLRGEHASDWIWLEGTREMKRMFDTGITAGRRHAGLPYCRQAPGDSAIHDEILDGISPEAEYRMQLEMARRVFEKHKWPLECVARAYGVDPADIVRRDDAK